MTPPTALLTEKQRAYLDPERSHETENPEQYRRQTRYEARKRAEQILSDLQLLEQTGNVDIVARFYFDISPLHRLRRAFLLDDVDNFSPNTGKD